MKKIIATFVLGISLVGALNATPRGESVDRVEQSKKNEEGWKIYLRHFSPSNFLFQLLLNANGNCTYPDSSRFAEYFDQLKAIGMIESNGILTKEAAEFVRKNIIPLDGSEDMDIAKLL
ncbi:TPA: hypothetical protein DEO28_04485 [Candidatus Dependentiae bacterium]|nr:MAG: hypothetical protein UR14_C0002G0015 [candidate division TM6 bacterium GW2011_GWE2_31_21]KKP53812.1 MAG: hypothetical protein UR43_C0002G0015 [candidate division TM6 bacterium GW2011_GWF2_33_332]HBS47592.1 hypothetical protein [Candidatus Dependentiae bacterium]HBZ73741.1 hypothetical protein [Candidatus Dependentiae bacterium]